VKLTRDLITNELLDVDAQFRGDKLKSYTTFGRSMDSTFQMIEPTTLSFYFWQKMQQERAAFKTANIRCAAMETIDITLSTWNIALMNAILTSISICFDTEEVSKELDFLEAGESEMIEQLASAIETDNADESGHSQSPSTQSTRSAFAESDK
jgi:hypothetical protein